MRAQRLGDALHRRQLRPHRTGAPLVEKPSGPGSALVGPEALERLFEQEGTHRAQRVLQDLPQLAALLDSSVLFALEKAPARVLEEGGAQTRGASARVRVLPGALQPVRSFAARC